MRTRRHAAHALLACAVALVFFQVAFHRLFASRFPHARDVEYGKKLARLKQIAEEKSPHQPLVVSFGSSLTAMGFCPAVVNDPRDPNRPVCYNFAINSCGIVVQLLCLKRLHEEGIHPDLALIELSPYFLTRTYNVVNNGEFLPPARLLPGDFEVLDRYHPDPARLRAEWREYQRAPWWSYRNNLQQWATPSATPQNRRIDHLWSKTDLWGWEHWPELSAIHGQYYLYPEPCEYLRGMWRKLTADPFDSQMEAAFGEAVDFCRANGIRPVVLIVPESSFLRSSYDPEGRRRFTEVVSRLRDVHGAEIVDARDWLADSQFIEGLHPNPAGAHNYTTRLDRDLLRKHYPAAVAAAR